MGILDTFSPVEYIPTKVKFLLFILLLAVLSPFINGLLLAGKGTIVCDSQRTPYVITGIDYNDLSNSGYLTAYYENAPDWITNKNREYWIKRKIERQRYLRSTEISSLGVELPLAFKKVGMESDTDCVKCSLGNYTNCYDSITETWTDMELRTSSEFPFWSRNLYYKNCGDGLQDFDERLTIILVSDTDGDYWSGHIYNVGFGNYSIDDLIHSTGVKYSIKYESDSFDFVSDLMPIACDRNFQPTITLIGIPIFNASTWIILTLLLILFKWNSWAKQHITYAKRR